MPIVLADPAASVEPATASVPEHVKPAQAEQATAVESVRVDAPSEVGPAVPLDPTVINQDSESPLALSVQALRGTNGSDFESYAAILRGAPDKHCLRLWLPCLFDERDFVSYGEVRKFCLVKNSNCFVYTTHTDQQPL